MEFLGNIVEWGAEKLEPLYSMSIFHALLAIILEIIWGILIFGAPITFPLLIWVFYKLFGKSSGSLKSSAYLNDLVKDIVKWIEQNVNGISNMQEFSALMKEQDWNIDIDNSSLNIIGKNIKYRVLFSTLGYDIVGKELDVRDKLKKIGKKLSKHLTIPVDIVDNSKYSFHTSTTPRYESTLNDGILNTKPIYDTDSTLIRMSILIKPHKRNNSTSNQNNSSLKRI